MRRKTSTHIEVIYLPKGKYSVNNKQKGRYGSGRKAFTLCILYCTVVKMALDCIANANLEDTGFNYTMSLIQGKYKMFILYALMEFKVVRFNELKRYIGTISYKTLSVTLKELESDNLVHREEYPQIPPKVEYSLTERGKSLIPILDNLCEWGDRNRIG